MQSISFTQLRSEPKKLKKALEEGKSVDLTHRAKTVGKIKPTVEPVKKFDAKKFKKIVDKLNLPYLTDKEIDKRYRKTMMKKHGKYLL